MVDPIDEPRTYAAGALLAGTLADVLGMGRAIAGIGGLTFVSGVLAAVQMPETLSPGSSRRPSTASVPNATA